jgi:hypothetical protein
LSKPKSRLSGSSISKANCDPDNSPVHLDNDKPLHTGYHCHLSHFNGVSEMLGLPSNPPPRHSISSFSRPRLPSITTSSTLNFSPFASPHPHNSYSPNFFDHSGRAIAEALGVVRRRCRQRTGLGYSGPLPCDHIAWPGATPKSSPIVTLFIPDSASIARSMAHSAKYRRVCIPAEGWQCLPRLESFFSHQPRLWLSKLNQANCDKIKPH